MSEPLPLIPQAVARALPDALNRRDVPLSRGRKLSAERARGIWRIRYYSAVRKNQGWGHWRSEWEWRTGEAPTLSLALASAGLLGDDERQVEAYLLDVAYRAELCP